MRIVRKNVYYCDFCKKKSLRSLKTHEKHCTGNPDRECRLCKSGESIKPIIEKYKKYFTTKEDIDYGDGRHINERYVTIKVIYHKEFTLEDIINEFDIRCPNCIFAVIRCLGLNRYYFEQKFKFDYKKELGSWWYEINQQALEEEQRY